jgi:hypothetical protein
MRHYEILANYCIPYFLDLGNCPQNCLFNFPKELILEAAKLVDYDFEENRYFSLLDDLFEYTKNNLTTYSLAKYILESI